MRCLPSLAVLLLAACGTPEDEPGVETDPPDCAPAPLNLTWTDATAGYSHSTVDYEVPWSGEARELGLEMWYPTDATTGATAIYRDFAPDEHALEDAPFADPAPGCKLPVLVYSHGSQSWGGSAATLTRHLAAQGWVIAAPDHTGNVFLADEGPHPLSFSLLRAEDVRRTIDTLEALPADHPLAGRLDTDNVLVVGHSYGAQTAWLLSGPTYDLDAIAASCGEACPEPVLDAFHAGTADPRVAAVMPLDGGAGADLVSAEGWTDAAVPIFVQSRDNSGSEDMFTRASGAEVTWVSIEGSCHESFTGNPISCDTLNKDTGLGIVGTYLSAWAARQILGQDDETVRGILDGTTVVSDLATLQRSR